jgi:hypothetical protein
MRIIDQKLKRCTGMIEKGFQNFGLEACTNGISYNVIFPRGASSSEKLAIVLSVVAID